MTERLFDVEGLNELGWEVPAAMSREAFMRDMARIQAMETVGPWAIGDGMNAGIMAFGDDAWQAIGLEYEEKSVNRMMRTCEDFPISRRRPKVSLWKAEAMRKLPEELQDHLMTLASEEALTLDGIRERADAYMGEDDEDYHNAECPTCGSFKRSWRREAEEVMNAASEA